MDNTGIPLDFGDKVALGFIVGVAVVGLTFGMFIRDNIKQLGALKAIGLTNRKSAGIVVSQATMIGSIGYAMVVIGSTLFTYDFSSTPTFKGIHGEGDPRRHRYLLTSHRVRFYRWSVNDPSASWHRQRCPPRRNNFRGRK